MIHKYEKLKYILIYGNGIKWNERFMVRHSFQFRSKKFFLTKREKFANQFSNSNGPIRIKKKKKKETLGNYQKKVRRKKKKIKIQK